MSINLLKQSPMCRFSVTLYIFPIFLARAHLEKNSILFELAILLWSFSQDEKNFFQISDQWCRFQCDGFKRGFNSPDTFMASH
jgi:hypothetical protein